MALIHSKQLNPKFTGSFTLSGSNQTLIGSSEFQGSVTASSEISSSSTITANTFVGTFNGALSSSAQIASNISGSFTSVSSSLAARLTSEEGEAEGSVVSSSAQIATDISGSWRGELSSSVYLRQVTSTISGSFTETSASIASDITEFKDGTVTLVSGSSTSTGSFGELEVDTNTTIGGDLFVSQFIKHTGDSNTFLNFTDDRLRFNIGGISYIDLNDSTSAPHDITFNDGGNNVDLTIKGSSNNPLFKTDASTSRIGTHGKGTPEVAFHIGGSELRVDGTISGSDYGGNISGSVTSTGSFGELEVDTNTTIGGDLFVKEYIKHTGDVNTAIRFTDNKISFDAGGMTFFAVHDDDSAPFTATVNGGGNKINFRALDENQDILLKTDSETFSVELYHAGNKKLETTSTGINVTGHITASGNVSSSATSTFSAGTFTGVFSGAVSSSVLSSPSQGTIRLATNGVNTDVDSGLQTSDSPTFAGGTVTGDLSVGGTLTAQEIHTEFTSASIIFTSGSTKFGDTMDDVHTMTGSLTVTGSVTADNFSGTFDGALSSSNQIATDISGSLGSNATLIRSLTATGISGSRNAGAISGSFRGELSSSVYLRQVATTISGSLGSNASVIRSLDRTTISGSFTSLSQSLAARITSEEGEAEGSVVSSSNQIATDISGSWRGELSSSVYLRQVASTISGSLGSNATLIRSLTAVGISGSLAEPGGNVSGSSTSTGSFGNINVGNVDVGGRITHNGDTDTRILFTDDDINITVGGLNMIDFTQDTVSEITINEEGVDIDFRVEGDNDANLLFIDGGNDKIGIGTNSSLTSLLTIDGDITTTHVTASGDISGSSTSTGSFGKVIVSEMGNSDLTIVSSSISTRLTTAESELGNTLISSSAQIATDISGSLGDNASLIRTLTAATISGSLGANASVIRTLDRTTLSGSFTSTSSSIASDIAEFKDGTITLVSGSSTSTGSFGRVEATGVVFADSFVSSTGGSTIDFNDDVSLAGSLTTTGKIELGREPVQGFNYLARLAEGEVSASSKAHTFTVTNDSKTSNHPYKNLGSGQGYVIDGVETPFLYLTEGYYKFDYSAASSHPVRFYFDAAKTTQYNPASHVSVDGNVITLKIDKDSPQIIYYQCSAHGYMGWAIHTGQNSLLQDANGMKVVVSGSSQIASNISGSLGSNASLIRTLTATTISGSLGSNASLIRTLTSATISGSLGSNASVIRTLDRTTLSGSLLATSSSIASDIASNLSSINTNTTNITTNTTNISTLTSKSGSYAITGSNHFKANQIISGSLTVTDTIIAQEFKTEFISASITFTSGSTKFGDTMDDVHNMTGSLNVTGSVTADNFSGTFSGALSSSSQIATDISGSITSVSSSIASDIAEFKDGTITLVSGSSTSTGSFGSIEVGGGHFTSASLAAGGGSANVDATSISGSWRGELSSSAITFVGGGVSGSLLSTGSFGKLLGDASSLTNLPSAAITNYASSGDNRIITSVNSTNVQGEANLTFDGSTLTLTGAMTSTGNISGSSTSTGSFGVIDVGGATFTSASLASGGGGSSVDAGAVSGSFRGLLSGSIVKDVGDGGVSGSLISTGSFGRVEATRFIGDGSGLSNVAASITVQEEGSNLTTALSSMNFVGDGITATTSGNDVTVTQELTKGAGDATVIDVSSASTTWAVTHSLENKYPTVTIYDENNQVIIPESITADTVNTATITFEQAVSGKASFTLGIPTSSLFISSSTQLLNQIADSTISGDLSVTGTLTAQEFHTEVTSASIVFTSGSTIFGDSSDDIHNMTGSLNISGSLTLNDGSLTVTDNVDFNGDLDVDGTTNLDAVDIDGAVDMASNLTIAGNVTGSSTSTGSFGRVNSITIDIDSIQGNWTNVGNTVADLGTITTVDINGGSIDGVTLGTNTAITEAQIDNININGSTIKDFSSVSGSSVSTGSFGEVTATGMTIASLTEFSSSVATKFNSVDGDIIALSIALG